MTSLQTFYNKPHQVACWKRSCHEYPSYTDFEYSLIIDKYSLECVESKLINKMSHLYFHRLIESKDYNSHQNKESKSSKMQSGDQLILILQTAIQEDRSYAMKQNTDSTVLLNVMLKERTVTYDLNMLLEIKQLPMDELM